MGQLQKAKYMCDWNPQKRRGGGNICRNNGWKFLKFDENYKPEDLRSSTKLSSRNIKKTITRHIIIKIAQTVTKGKY